MGGAAERPRRAKKSGRFLGNAPFLLVGGDGLEPPTLSV